MHQIENSFLSLSVNEGHSLTAVLKKTGEVFRMLPSSCPVSDVQEEEGALLFTLQREEGAVTAKATLTDNGFQIVMHSDGVQEKPFCWPPAWSMEQGDVGIYPLCSGCAVPADDLDFPILEEHKFYQGVNLSMCIIGFLRNGTGLFSCLENGINAEAFHTTINGLRHTSLRWIGSKGNWEGDKTIRFFFSNGLADGCRMYRRWREEQGRVFTLSQKLAKAPEAAKLAGCADIWIWEDNNMNRLYGRPEIAGVPAREPRKIADEMLELGMENVLWNSFEGETPEDCAYLKSKGFLVGKYDIYRDVMPKTDVDKIIPYRVKRSVNTPLWPDICRVDRDGSLAKAWQLHGLDGKFHDQNAVCDKETIKLVKRNALPDIERVGYNSRLIDVQAGATLCECWSPVHPCTRAQSLEAILEEHQILCDRGIVMGVEVGSEATLSIYHYSEGMMSPDTLRPYEAGRKMTTIYTGDDIPEVFRKYSLNPKYRIPLWQLVYHDCAASYFYWGDSSNCCPELMKRRDLLCALYGEGPLYSLTVSQWNQRKQELAESYHRVSPICQKVRFAAMTDFAILTEDAAVQRTTFANGVTVTVNFSPNEVTLPDGTLMPPESVVVYER